MLDVTVQLDDRERRALRLKAREATLNALKALGGEARREQIRERALADGGFTPRELEAPPPEAIAVKFERLVDHQLAWSLTNLKRDGLVENPKRSVWKLNSVALGAPEPATREVSTPDRLGELRTMVYRDYLRSPEWRRTRAAALHRAGNACSLDITHTGDLEVHHRTYERLGEELASDLIVLCRDCHRLHHAEHGRPRRAEERPRSALREKSVDQSLHLIDQGRPSLLRRLLAR
jgi:5-methylcytosine-specific restriction endonuclease McrA